MSGGVDSAVTSLLLKESGYDVLGLTLNLCPDKDTSCGSLAEAQEAAKVASLLGIPHTILDGREEFDKNVIAKFVESYENGSTPNPCVNCNRYVKFAQMLSFAESQRATKIATGHYARIEKDTSGRFLLKKGADQSKDQSYVLYCLTQEQLSHILFPLGQYCKSDVRQIAEQHGFSNARKSDSQDICFIPDGDYADFIGSYTGKTFPSGYFVDLSGNVIGKHNGIIRYTIGQRKGLGMAFGKPTYVCGKNVSYNTVVLGEDKDLYSSTFTARDLNWIACDGLFHAERLSAKVRYKQSEQPATVEPLDDGRIRVTYDEPQRAISPGQSVVLYDGDVVVGGGIIE